MSQGINLLKREKAKNIQLLELIHTLKVSSFVFLIFYCLVVLAIFSYSVYLKQGSEKNSSEIEAKKSKIVELKKVESQQITLKQRLSSLTSLTVKEGPGYNESLSQLEEALESGVAIKEIKFDGPDSMKISGKAQQAVVLTRFFEKLAEKSIFSKIILSSLARQKDGGWLFALDLRIG